MKVNCVTMAPHLTPTHLQCLAVALWLGMAKAGVSTALVNIHIKGPPLVHAIRTALGQSKDLLVVVDESLADCVLCHDVLAELPAAVRSCFVASRGPFRAMTKHQWHWLCRCRPAGPSAEDFFFFFF